MMRIQTIITVTNAFAYVVFFYNNSIILNFKIKNHCFLNNGLTILLTNSHLNICTLFIYF